MAIPLSLGIPAVTALGSSLLDGAVKLFGTAQTNSTNEKIARMNNEFNAQQSELQYQRQINLWNMQNDYNTPTNQLARLEAAGLSPYLAYSNGAAGGTASSMTAPSAVRAENYTFQSPLNALAVFGQLVPAVQSIMKTDKEIDILEGQNQKQNIENSFLAELLRQQIDNLKATYWNTDASTSLTNIRANREQGEYNLFAKYGEAERALEYSMLANRSAASTYDKRLAAAALSASTLTNALHQQEWQYNQDFGFRGRLDWQKELLGVGKNFLNEAASTAVGLARRFGILRLLK